MVAREKQWVRAAADDPRQEYCRRLVAAMSSYVWDQLPAECVFVYGSFGRGEASVMLDGDVIRPVSDVELGVLVARPVSPVGIRRIAGTLSEAHGVEVTLGLFSRRRFRSLCVSNWDVAGGTPTLEQYELLSGMRVTEGTDPRTDSLRIDPQDIPPWDAVRLLGNRIAELLIVLNEKKPARVELDKAVAKALVAVGDVYLLAAGQYDVSYAGRRDLLDTLLVDVPIRNKVLSAYGWRLNPSGSIDVPYDEVIRDALLPAWLMAVSRMAGVQVDQVDAAEIEYLGYAASGDASRVYRGRRTLQGALVSAKGLMRGGGVVSPFSAAHRVHATYCMLVRWASYTAEPHRAEPAWPLSETVRCWYRYCDMV